MSSKAELDKKRKQLKRAYRLIDYLRVRAIWWCPIVSSHAIRKSIVDRMNDLGVSMFEIALRADVSYNSISKYWLGSDEPLSRPSVRAEDIIKIGELIGIKIRITVVEGDINNVDRTKLLNDKFIPRGRRKKNKKLG